MNRKGDNCDSSLLAEAFITSSLETPILIAREEDTNVDNISSYSKTPLKGLKTLDSIDTASARELYLSRMTISELRPYFNQPINEVAKEMNICITLIKKICRRNGVTRWPHRRIKSLVTKITNAQDLLGSSATTTSSLKPEHSRISLEIKALKNELAAVIENPEYAGIKRSDAKTSIEDFVLEKHQEAVLLANKAVEKNAASPVSHQEVQKKLQDAKCRLSGYDTTKRMREIALDSATLPNHTAAEWKEICTFAAHYASRALINPIAPIVKDISYYNQVIEPSLPKKRGRKRKIKIDYF